MEFGKWIEENPILPSVPIVACPIATTLGVLGRKWSLLILRDIAMRKEERFTELLRSVEGITRRVLSMRLRELESEGLIMRSVDKSKKPSRITWDLTEKGWDALPILMSYFAFGSKWYSRKVFKDKKEKEMVELFPQKQLRHSFVNLEVS
jgi:DNA-binding HxlR family transcriptional regulator